jgi:hypothetical protein
MPKLTVVYREHYPEKEERIHCISGEFMSVLYTDGCVDINEEELLNTNPDKYGNYDDIEFLEIDGLVLIGNRAEWQKEVMADDRQGEERSDGRVSGRAAAVPGGQGAAGEDL